ncbi:glycosyltransferase family 39 protein [Amycolatopsis sp. NEAU-NG30]|uniref:Glycosyltransferase family 39 protein n=1 Tax=Amycolatopsis melonis TaxID=3156488 RepID=A0ABV0LA01_9PSEU
MTTMLSAPVRPVPAAAPEPRWVKPSVAALLLSSGVLYLWNLAKNGWGNDFYAMAVQAGTWSWKALFFGSLDPGNVVTVDKPPFSLWVMGLSGRIFGFSSWSLLVPDALAGVASVGLLYLAVRRISGPGAGLLAGAGLALTPVAALMFRYDNPDAFLVLLLVAAAYCLVRALEHASTKWLVLAGAALGFGFLDKMLQAFLVLPAFVLTYAVAAPVSLGRRIGQLCAAAAAVLVSAGWWVLAVAVWPVANRPYISGSTDNSVLQLAFGYNGLSRIFGGSHGGGRTFTPPSGAGPRAGTAGLTRLFSGEFGGEASWLLPAALVGLAAGLWFTRRAPRTDATRAALLLWGGWLAGTALVLSYMSGIIHSYYTVALAPGVAATVAISTRELWRGRANFAARVVLAVMLAVTVVWSFLLLARVPQWQPWIRYTLLALGAAVVLTLLFGTARLRRLGPAVAVLGLCAAMLGTTSFTLATAAKAHTGGGPTSGPSVAKGHSPGIGTGQPSAALIGLLRTTTTKWAAAQTSAMQAAGLALASGRPVLAIGGFSGNDPAPTLTQFQEYVTDGDVRYYVAGGRGGFGGRRDSGEIQSWVERHFAPVAVGGTTVYDLAKPVG